MTDGKLSFDELVQIVDVEMQGGRQDFLAALIARKPAETYYYRLQVDADLLNRVDWSTVSDEQRAAYPLPPEWDGAA